LPPPPVVRPIAAMPSPGPSPGFEGSSAEGYSPAQGAPAQAAQAQAPQAQAAQPAVDTRYCSECGRPFPANQLYSVGGANICASCYPAYVQRTSQGAMQPAQPVGARRYGGFWIRFVARVIDGILLAVVGGIIRIPLFLLMGGTSLLTGIASDDSGAAARAAIPAVMGMAGLSFLIQIALSVAYEVYFLTTRGATLGKQVLGLKVVRADGGPISAGLAAGRFFAYVLSGMILAIGYIIAAFDSEKRALHDHICNTRVICSR
jgi:uncharacterized RDD family membrane protein YckC